MTISTTRESQTTSSITVSNGQQTSTKSSSRNESHSQSNECLTDEDEHTMSCRTVSCSHSVLTSSLDYNTASKVLLVGYLRKARAFDHVDYHKIEEDKWRLRLFKLRIDGTLHWYQYANVRFFKSITNQ